MPKVRIPYGQVTNEEQAYAAVKKHLTPENLSKFKVAVDLKTDDAAKSVKAEGKGFKLNVAFFPKELELDLDLSLMLKPFGSTIMSQIQEQLKRYL